MRTVVEPVNNGSIIYFNWTPENPDIPYYAVWHFVEAEVLDVGQVREFSVCVGNVLCSLRFRVSYLLASVMHFVFLCEQSDCYSSIERTASSTLPPL